MPLPINIHDLLDGKSVEWERLEFKSGWNPEGVLHTVCAFANDFHNLGGGYLFLGINEVEGRPQLPPAGLPANKIDRIQQEILNLGHRILPHYHPVVEPYLIDEKHVLVLWVPGGQNRPYKAPVSLAKSQKELAYYIRKLSSTVKASHDEEIELQELSAKVPFDDRTNHQAAVSELKLSLIQAHLREIGSDLLEPSNRMRFVDLGKRMRIVDGPKEYVKPRNVGLMFFNENPEEYFPQTQIDVVQLPEGPGGNIIRERSFTGPVGKQARDALSYIQTNIIQGVVIKRPDRAESDRFFNYPYPAIEEALVNAVYHRSYEVREPIEVRVLPDHITITSYPGPDRSISISDLEAGTFIARRYRNRRIGEFLKELRLTEGRGTGVPKIIRAMQNNGSPRPRFVTDEERTFFTTILSAHPASNLGDGGSLTPQVTPQVTPQASNIGKNEVNILFYCIEPRSKSEITQYLGLKDDRHVRNRYVQPLIDEGLLEMTRPESPRSPNQKYRTTEVGRGVLSVISSDENSK